jgi:TonB family protein
MPKPLRSEQIVQPKDIQFTHFGVLNTGSQGKGSLFTSILINVVIVLIAIILGAVAKVTVENDRKKAELVDPTLIKKPEPPPPPKIVKPLPPVPEVKPVEPKIVLPEVKIEPPKVQPVMMPKPLPMVVPAPPKVVVAAAAPKPTTVTLGRSASVVNNSPKPSAVALGRSDNPIAPSNRPATAAVDLGQRGLGGMPASNSGTGPRSTTVNLGSGQPNGSLNGGGARAVQGVKLGGITGGTGTGPGNGIGARNVQLGQSTAVAPIRPAGPVTGPVSSAPQVTYKPQPVYTAEARALHLEGSVSVRVRVLANGTVQVLGVSSGLGHGLDQSALNVAQGMHFKPARDARGNPVDWEGVVKVTFQMAG